MIVLKNEILFGYRLGNADCCTEGDDDGFLFVIYNDGTAIYNKYVVHDIVTRSRRFKVSNKTISEINSVLDRYKKKISAFDTDIDNGSYDGDFNIFTFRNKKINTLNIEEHNIKETTIRNPKYLKEYYNVMVQENKIMNIFKKICAILWKNHAIRMKLESLFIPFWLF